MKLAAFVNNVKCEQFLFLRPAFHPQSPFELFTPEVHQQRHAIENSEGVEPSPSDRSIRDADVAAGFSLRENNAATVIDEVDSAFRSPILSECTTEASENIPQATYVVLSSDDIMQLNVSRSALDVLTDISAVSLV
jgi:hypothetical protein